MHSWSTFGAQTRHGQTRIHNIHHSPNLGEATTFPLIVLYVLGHRASTQVRSLEILEIGTLATLEAHNFFENLRLR